MWSSGIELIVNAERLKLGVECRDRFPPSIQATSANFLPRMFSVTLLFTLISSTDVIMRLDAFCVGVYFNQMKNIDVRDADVGVKVAHTLQPRLDIACRYRHM